jgi:hypothetical protein
LFQAVFAPEDCFSVQFVPTLCINAELWTRAFSFLQNLTNQKQNYLEASLRSLTLSSRQITDEQLHFIFSNLKRITKCHLDLDRSDKVTSSGINAIGENLLELTELRIAVSMAVNASVLQFLQQNSRN